MTAPRPLRPRAPLALLLTVAALVGCAPPPPALPPDGTCRACTGQGFEDCRGGFVCARRPCNASGSVRAAAGVCVRVGEPPEDCAGYSAARCP